MDSAARATSDARALAADLAAMDDEALEGLLTQRAISATVPWRDFFDAAEALVDPASIDRALTRLSRTALITVHSAAGGTIPPEARPSLAALGLVRSDGALPRAVAERIQSLAAERPGSFDPVPPIDPLPAATALECAVAAEQTALSIAALADVILSALSAPLARTGAGAVTAADRRRLVESGAVSSGEELDDLLASGVAAGLAVEGDREWLVTLAGEQWLSATTVSRWAQLVEGLRASLPAALRDADGGYLPPALWEDAYPLDADWSRRAQLLRRIAQRWALIAPSGAEPDWARPLRQGAAPDTAALSALLPPEIDRIYLQADLSAIAPGPLAPALDLRLRSMATRESRAQASTYRFTAESLTRAVGTGETAESLRGFLSQLSLSGIPQPLDYLIERTAARHGLVRVGLDAASGRTRVASDDDAILDTLVVDQSVRSVGLVRDGDSLTSRVGRDAVYWTLIDARYPAVAVDAAGDTEPLHRRRLGVVAGAQPTRHARLIDVLRHSAPSSDTDAAWLDRDLEAAVRARATIVVVVALPDGSTREFTLEPTGLGGGRLRGRDKGADTERTLPVSSIVSARPA